METIELNALPHAKATDVLATGAPVYLFVNPVEYHGPHLPLYNDYHLSFASSQDLHRRLQKKHPEWPFIHATPLHMGVDPVPGFGSIPFSYLAVRKAVLTACRALEELGAKRVVLATFHGSPLHAAAIQAGVDYLARRGIPAVAPFNFVLHELLHYRVGDFSEALTLIADEKTRRHVAEHLDQDFHGGFFETSLVLHYRPDTVAPSHRTLPPCPPVAPHRVFLWLSRAAARLGRLILAAEFKFAAYGIGWLRLRPLPGYTGWPALADARAGAAFAEVIMSRYVDGVEAVFAGSKPPPQPIMKWLRAVSLDGRLQAH